MGDKLLSPVTLYSSPFSSKFPIPSRNFSFYPFDTLSLLSCKLSGSVRELILCHLIAENAEQLKHLVTVTIIIIRRGATRSPYNVQTCSSLRYQCVNALIGSGSPYCAQFVSALRTEMSLAGA